MTSKEVLTRFFEATTAAGDGIQHRPQTTGQRAKLVDAARKEPDAAGI
jgi:hypothetical protein